MSNNKNNNQNITESEGLIEINDWEDLDTNPDLLRGIYSSGFEKPSPIQKKAIRSMFLKNDVIVDMGYQCKSCVYCQASVSLLSRKIKEQSLNSIKEFLANAEHTFDNDAPTLKKYWRDFNQILDKKNLARKECLLLPLRTVMKALNS